MTSTLRPGSVVPGEPPPRPSRPGRRWAVAGAVALLALGAGTVGLLRERAVVGRADPLAGEPAPLPPAPIGTTAAPPAPAPTASRPSPAAPVAPRGYQVVSGPEGYRLAVPRGWSAEVKPGVSRWWGDLTRAGVKLLFVDVTVAAGRSRAAATNLRTYESRRRQTSNIFYHRVRLEPRPLIPGAGSVADLEFTDRDEYQTYHFHTYLRDVVTPGGRLYQVELAILHEIYQDDGSTEGDWARAEPVVRQILASFRLGASP